MLDLLEKYLYSIFKNCGHIRLVHFRFLYTHNNNACCHKDCKACPKFEAKDK